MKKLLPLSFLLSVILLSGCTSGRNYGEEEFLTEREQKAALAKTKSPAYFGYNAFPAQGGIGFRGTARLHPNHQAELDFIEQRVPVIKIAGRANRLKANALLDFSASSSMMEFSIAEEFGAVFMGMKDDLVPYQGVFSGDVNAYAAVINQFRFDQLFVEDIPLYVRMSRGSLGPFARTIFDPHVDVSFGYDLLGLFETIQLNLRDGKVIFSSSHRYAPHEDLLMSTTKILNAPGYGLVVEGAIFGEATPIVLDPAGNYHFMRGDVNVAQTKQVSLGDVVYRKVPTTLLPIKMALPRAGRLMLEDYIITICPTQGVVYFERFPE
ncbi:hypothetical protein P4E94_17805 [Pontiellaceae bacterium B12219]|nr:hypothetical protein [Pontiellaceae bacterium B12219]